MANFIHLSTISDLKKLLKSAVINHPLITVIDFSPANDPAVGELKITTDFYSIIFKNYCSDKIKYGRKNVDFQDGSLLCMAPNQVLETDHDAELIENLSGWGLFFHPDLLRETFLLDKIDEYSFFSYEIAEGLHLSAEEIKLLDDCLEKIKNELIQINDPHSEQIIVSLIDLILNYCSRFYGRQFCTRKGLNLDIIAQAEKLLRNIFRSENLKKDGFPTVKFLADNLNLSPGYLSDLLKKETGKNAQEHIHFYLITEAKNFLLNSNKSVSEIALDLGFEYPQYFSRLFKQKTGKTPLEFRNNR